VVQTIWKFSNFVIDFISMFFEYFVHYLF